MTDIICMSTGNSPYTPIPIETRTQVSEHLESEVKRLMSASLSRNTQLAYRHALQSLDQYLNGQPFTDGELARLYHTSPQ